MDEPRLRSRMDIVRDKLAEGDTEREASAWVAGHSIYAGDADSTPDFHVVVDLPCPLIPAPEYLIISKTEAAERVGSIHLPSQVAQKSRPTAGTIVASSLADWKIGTVIWYHEYAEVRINHMGVEYIAVKGKDVICQVK